METVAISIVVIIIAAIVLGSDRPTYGQSFIITPIEPTHIKPEQSNIGCFAVMVFALLFFIVIASNSF